MGPLMVTVSVDGAVLLTAAANGSRADLVAVGAAPSPDHGFTIGLPPAVVEKLRKGKHTIAAAAGAFALGASPRCLCDFVPCPC
jgi:hypothetical protein